MKKIFVISAGRSDYDRYYPIISELNKKKKNKTLVMFNPKSPREYLWQNNKLYIERV